MTDSSRKSPLESHNESKLSIQPSLNNLESIMKAAEIESKLLKDPEIATIIGSNSDTEEFSIFMGEGEQGKSIELQSIPEIPALNQQNPNMPDIKEALSNTNISTMLNKMASNPEEVSKMMEQSMSQMTPEMMEQARKLAMGGQGDQIMREMQKRGMDPRAMRSQLLEQQRAIRGMGSSKAADATKQSSALSGQRTKQIILINKSRQIKVRKVPSNSVGLSAASILKTDNPVELSCSRMAQGPLSGKTIKAWYNPEDRGKNRRATKVVGFPVGGEVIVVMEEGDLTEKDFSAAEKHLE